jgi:hypothetical protein
MDAGDVEHFRRKRGRSLERLDKIFPSEIFLSRREAEL